MALTLSPDPTGDDLTRDLEAQLAALPPEQRAQVEAALRQLAAMTPEERQAALAAMQADAQRQGIAAAADQARDAALAARRGQIDPAQLIRQLEQAAAQAAEGEAPGSPYDELAAYLRAVVALLRGEPPPPVPALYAGHIAAIQAAG